MGTDRLGQARKRAFWVLGRLTSAGAANGLLILTCVQCYVRSWFAAEVRLWRPLRECGRMALPHLSK
jgi:hypothetical protein